MFHFKNSLCSVCLNQTTVCIIPSLIMLCNRNVNISRTTKNVNTWAHASQVCWAANCTKSCWACREQSRATSACSSEDDWQRDGDLASSGVTLSQTTMALLWWLSWPACCSVEVSRSASRAACHWDVPDKEGALKLYFCDFMWLLLPSQVARADSMHIFFETEPLCFKPNVFSKTFYTVCDSCQCQYKLLIGRRPTAVPCISFCQIQQPFVWLFP